MPIMIGRREMAHLTLKWSILRRRYGSCQPAFATLQQEGRAWIVVNIKTVFERRAAVMRSSPHFLFGCRPSSVQGSFE